ncbi:MAG: hypothetical protein ABR920_11190 [Terriglobales bacterium]
MLGIIQYALFKANIDRKNDLIKTLQDQLAARPVPEQTTTSKAKPTNFRLWVPGGNVFVPDQEPTLTGIQLDVRIVNTGDPSRAMDWKLSVIPPHGSPQIAQLTKIPPSLVARGDKSTAHINESESLDEYCLENPLNDVPHEGKLLFYVRLPKRDVLESVLELTVSDLDGHSFLLRKDMKEWLQR